jgi:hypothetical protein
MEQSLWRGWGFVVHGALRGAMMRDGAACPAQAEIDLATADGSGEEGAISPMLPCAGGNPLDIAHADHVERGAFVGLRVTLAGAQAVRASARNRTRIIR